MMPSLLALLLLAQANEFTQPTPAPAPADVAPAAIGGIDVVEHLGATPPLDDGGIDRTALPRNVPRTGSRSIA